MPAPLTAPGVTVPNPTTHVPPCIPPHRYSSGDRRDKRKNMSLNDPTTFPHPHDVLGTPSRRVKVKSEGGQTSEPCHGRIVIVTHQPESVKRRHSESKT